MISDDERREVARRLREMPNSATWTADRFGEALLHLLVYGNGRESFNRLADLIEPGEPEVKCVAEVKIDGERLEQLVHDVAVELTGIDRDALLALADEMQEDAEWCNSISEKHMVWAGVIRGYSDRIREALGVSDKC